MDEWPPIAYEIAGHAAREYLWEHRPGGDPPVTPDGFMRAVLDSVWPYVAQEKEHAAWVATRNP